MRIKGPEQEATVTAPKRRPGRPPRSTTPSLERIEIRVTPDERWAWEQAARREDKTLSEWIRGRCNR